MTSTKDYLALLKRGAKKSKQVEFNNGIAYVDTPQQGRMAYALSAPDGYYSITALDVLALDATADISAYRLEDASENGDMPPIKEKPVTASKELAKKIKEASQYVSRDEFRPILQRVCIRNGEVWATDGYRAYATAKELEGITCDFSADFAYVLDKIGGGEIRANYNVVELFKDGFVYRETQIADQYPDLRQVINKEVKADTMVKFPLRDVKGLADKKDYEVGIDMDGSITLAGKPLPVKATLAPVLKDIRGDVAKKIFMPMAEGKAPIVFDVNNLKPLKTDKNGDVYFYVNLHRDNPMERSGKPQLIVV